MKNIVIYADDQKVDTDALIYAASIKGLKPRTICSKPNEVHHYKVLRPSNNLRYEEALDLVLHFGNICGVTDIKIQGKHENINSTLRY